MSGYVLMQRPFSVARNHLHDAAQRHASFRPAPDYPLTGRRPSSASGNVDFVRSIFAAWERGELRAVDWADPEIEFVFADGPSFNFFQAVRLLEKLSPDREPVGFDGPAAREVARFTAHVSHNFPPSQIFEIRPDRSSGPRRA